MATADPATDLPTIPPESKTRAPELPDASVFWKWVGRSTRPVWGWVCVGIGVILIIVGYLGVSREALVAKQLPYLISGGILGVAFVGFGAMLIGTEDMKRAQERIDRLEVLIEDLHGVLLSRADAPAIASTNGHSVDARESARTASLLALPGGQSFHRADCSMIQGKSEAKAVTAAQVRKQGLKPCRLCEPDLASSRA